MLIALFFMTLLIISLAAAAPQVAKSIQRERELETFHRGMQYRRAVQLYYRKFHAYPPNVNALVNTNDIRFLRKKYNDPMSRADDWKPVMYGQNKTPTAMGFFGQAVEGNASTIAGVGPSGGNSGSAFGSSGNGSSLGSSFGSTPGSTFGSPGPSGGASGSAPSAGMGTSGSGGTATGGASPGSDSSSGQTFGGMGIIGFSPGVQTTSIRIYKKKTHFNEWEFTYDPISDMQTITGGNNGALGQSGGNNGAPPIPPVNSILGTQNPNAPPSTPPPSGLGSTPNPPSSN